MRTERPAAAGGTMVIVLALCAMLFALVLSATMNQRGLQTLRSGDMHVAEAQYAAESVAAMLEGKLVGLSGNLDNLTRDLATYHNAAGENFWNLRGWLAGDGETDPRPASERTRGLRLGNCVVRWRVEPASIVGDGPPPATADNVGELPAGQPFAVNNAANVSDPAWQTFLTGAGGSAARVDNGAYYHFRIVTEAIRVSDPAAADPRPWDGASQRLAIAQAHRVVQLRLQSLFKYVIFYAATGPTGDLDLWAGTNIDIFGAVHSNGAIYLGGQGTQHLSGNYKDAASSYNTMNIGTAGSPVPVTGVDGIFRMRKPVNYYAAVRGVSGASYDPMSVPLSGVGGMTGSNDLNGNDTASTNMMINGQKFTWQVDSRRARSAAFGATSMEGRFAGRVRDRQLGANVVRTLANIPELAGRPMELLRLAADDAAIYVRLPASVPATAVTSPIDWSSDIALPSTLDEYGNLLANLTLSNNGGGKRLFYSADPTTYPGATLRLTVTPTAWPVPATNLPLYWQDSARTARDLAPISADFPDPLLATSAAAGQPGYDVFGFRANAAWGFYAERAMYGEPGSTGRGLLVVERPWPADPALTKPCGLEGVAIDARGSGYTSAPTVAFATATGDSGRGATGTAVLTPLILVRSGSGYTTVPTVTISGGGGSGATATAVISKPMTGAAGGVTIATTNAGSNYTSNPAVTVATTQLKSGPGLTAVAVRNAATKKITGITFTDPGGATNPSYYAAAPTITISGGGGSSAALALNFGTHFSAGRVHAVTLTAPGSGYTSTPTITISGGGGTNAAAIFPTGFAPGQIYQIDITNPGIGYLTAPTITLSGGGGSGASLRPLLPGRPLSGSLAMSNLGAGYDPANPPAVRFSGGGGAGARATATVDGTGRVTAVTMTDWGAGFTAKPTITIDPPPVAPPTGVQAVVDTAALAIAPAHTGPSPEVRQALVSYLASQYAVFFGELDVTDAFFGQILDPVRAPTRNDFVVSEDDFVNRREHAFLARFYGVSAANLANFAGTGLPYRVNVLTFNMQPVQDFLAARRLQFSGLIYAARTRRSFTYDPLQRPHLLFNPGPGPEAIAATTYRPRLDAGTGAVVTAAPYNPATPADAQTPLSTATYPHIYREGSGGIETFHAGVRLRNGARIRWNHDSDGNGFLDAAALLGRSGLTVMTPNPMYVQGNYNRQVLVGSANSGPAGEVWEDYTVTLPAGQLPQPIATHKFRLPPCAIFADGITPLSGNWNDAANQVIELGSSSLIPAGSDTYIYASAVINNVPSRTFNACEEGSGAVPNVMRFLENGSRAYYFLGSLVVLNEARYSRGLLGASGTAHTLNTPFYVPPSRNYRFNSDLFQSAGQPPFSPWGMEVTRVLSSVNSLR